MGLTSRTTLWVLVALTVALPLAVLLGWPRVRGPRPVRAGQRLALVALCQGVAVLLCFVAVNDHYVFFASWQDLLGKPVTPPPVVEAGGSRTTADGGRLLEIHSFTGPASGITAPVLVVLPPQYDQPAYAHRRFPVVELLPGWHAYPTSWINQLHLIDDLKALESQQAVQPFIAVLPTLNVALPRDTECTDVPGGPQAETWLATDVRRLVLDRFRALPGPASWGAMGYSTGGYCAAKLALRHPQAFGSAVVISGYFEAVRDSTTGDLWGGSPARRQANDLLWRVRHLPNPPVHVLVFASKEDRDSYRSSARFLRDARPPLRTASVLVPKGGHNLKVVRLALPQLLRWLSSHLAGEPPATLHG